MSEKYIKYGVYILIIFICIIIIGNVLAKVYPDKRPNSMYFDEIEESPMKQDVRNTDIIALLLKESLNDMTEYKYESIYNSLSDKSKEKFGGTIEKFGEIMAKDYITKLSIINVQYGGHNAENDTYIYDVYLSGPPDQTKLTEEELKLVIDRYVCLILHIDENNDYTIDFDV